MENTPNSNARAGWEQIWTSSDIPPVYQSSAPPNAAVVEWADTVTPGGFVLDVGCGVGRHLLYLGGRGFQLAGVDVSPSGVQMTREACAARQLTVDGRVSDMTTLSWADMTFDAALSTSTIHHNLRAGIIQTLSEIRRVLKPGGVFLVDLLSTDRADYQWQRSQVAAGLITEVEPNTFVDERADSKDSDGFLPHHYSDEADVRDLLRPFDILSLVNEARENPANKRGKWVAWLRKPLSDG